MTSSRSSDLAANRHVVVEILCEFSCFSRLIAKLFGNQMWPTTAATTTAIIIMAIRGSNWRLAAEELRSRTRNCCIDSLQQQQQQLEQQQHSRKQHPSGFLSFTTFIGIFHICICFGFGSSHQVTNNQTGQLTKLTD